MKITIPGYAREVIEKLNKEGYQAYVVGGCVRDSLMGKTPHDWDICTDCLPERALELFRKEHTVIATGLKHGTVTVVIDHCPVEVTTFRSDGAYADHRRPDSVIFEKDLRSDLKRRDFTVNAMCWSPEEGLIDLFGGAEDLENGVLRCVGRPEDRFNEDALRIMRAMRFASVLDLTVEEDTARAMHEGRELLKFVSAERIFSELKKLLCGPAAERILTDFRDIMGVIIPELIPCFDCPQNNIHHCFDVYRHICRSVSLIDPDPVLRLTMLMHDIEKPAMRTTDEFGQDHFKLHPLRGSETAGRVLRRLKASNDERRTVMELVLEHDNRIPAQRRSVKRFLARHGDEFWELWMKVRRADTLAQSEFKRAEKLAQLDELEEQARQIRAEECCLSLKDLAVNGRDMTGLGLKGADIGRTLKMLLDAVVEDKVPNTREELLGYLRRITDDEQD